MVRAPLCLLMTFVVGAALLTGCVGSSVEAPLDAAVDDAAPAPWRTSTHELHVPAGLSFGALLLEFDTDEGGKGLALDRHSFPDGAYVFAYAFRIDDGEARLTARTGGPGSGWGALSAGNGEAVYSTLFLVVFDLPEAATLRLAEWDGTPEFAFPEESASAQWHAQGAANVSYYHETSEGVVRALGVEVERAATPSGLPVFGGALRISSAHSDTTGMVIAGGRFVSAGGGGMQHAEWTADGQTRALDAPAVGTPAMSVQGFSIVQLVDSANELAMETTGAGALPFVSFEQVTLPFDPASLGLRLVPAFNDRWDLPVVAG